VIFGFSFAFDNSSFYDPCWSVAPLPIALYFVAVGDPGGALAARQRLVLLALSLWSARLAWNWARSLDC
jgi:steroid 5-alpha reductase family enzyme